MGRSLSKDIVIVNEFTFNGSRGNSPGRYVIEYMARDKGTENLTPTPVRSNKVKRMSETVKNAYKASSALKSDNLPGVEEYILRYMARDMATEILNAVGETNTGELYEEFDAIQGNSGKGFSESSISLSHKEVNDYAKLIQKEYESGKPVLKTVISFDTDYLKEMGVLPKDLVVRKKGDLYGKSDQAKLRLAIQHGLSNISHEYSDLKYFGVIQVDTKHIHCHLAMVDAGEGKRFTVDGEQKGMITAEMRTALRRGIDNSLTQCKLIKPYSIQMEAEKRNTLSFVKRFTHRIMNERGLPQHLMCCLPKDDKSLWKASINTDGGDENEMHIKKGKTVKTIKGNMKKANAIVKAMVIDMLNRPESGYSEALQAQHDYLEARKERGEFDDYYIYRMHGTGKSRKSTKMRVTPDEAIRHLEFKFRDQVIERSMNAVYDILKRVDDDDLSLHTPFLDVMSMPYEDMIEYVKDDKLIEFGFRLRSYANRLDFHVTNLEHVNNVLHQYEDGSYDRYSPDSKVVYDFLQIEKEYNHGLMDKYRSFLHFFHVKEEFKEDFDDLMYLKSICMGHREMKKDKSFSKAKDMTHAEIMGNENYGLSGGAILFSNPAAFDNLIEDDDARYAKYLRNFTDKLSYAGMLFDEAEGVVKEGNVHKFDDVKAYDLHHMTYDFTYDFKIAEHNIKTFSDLAYRRYDAWLKAIDYLEQTGQPGILDTFVNPDDIQIMKDLADEYKFQGPVYKTKFDDAAQIRRHTATMRLDNEIFDSLSDAALASSVKSIIDDLSSDPEYNVP